MSDYECEGTRGAGKVLRWAIEAREAGDVRRVLPSPCGIGVAAWKKSDSLAPEPWSGEGYRGPVNTNYQALLYHSLWDLVLCSGLLSGQRWAQVSTDTREVPGQGLTEGVSMENKIKNVAFPSP